MNSISRILVPVDFTHHSQAILSQALDIAQRAEAEVIVLHVHSRPTVSKSLEKSSDLDLITAMEKSMLNRLRKKIKNNYDTLLAETTGHENIRIKFMFELGTVVDKLLEIAEQQKVNLILMGTRGIKGLEEFWGTKTAEICMRTKIPVLVLPYHRKPGPLENIAYAYDLKSVPNLQMLNLVKLFSTLYRSQIHIITVNTVKEMTEEESGNLEKIREHFKEFDPVIKNQYGEDAEKGIFNYLEENQIQMLVVLHRYRSFLKDLFHESMTSKISFHSNIPVLALDERNN